MENRNLSNNKELIDIKSLQDEANSEILESMFEGILPKLKIFIPKAIKSIDEDDSSIIDSNSIIIIARSEEDNSVVVMQGKKDNIDLSVDNMEDLEINDLSTLFDKILTIFSESKK